jgi:hypothetical protein
VKPEKSKLVALVELATALAVLVSVHRQTRNAGPEASTVFWFKVSRAAHRLAGFFHRLAGLAEERYRATLP